jgi:uncharacterized protein
MMPGAAELTIAAAALVASFTAGLSGFAFGLVALGLWLHLLPPAEAGPLVVLCSLTGQMLTSWSLRQSFRPDLFWPFIVGGLIGVPAGVAILKYAPADPLRRGFGLFLIAYCSYALLRAPIKPMTAGGRAADGAIGMVGGVMGGIAGLSGAIPVLWCDLRGWGKAIGRGVYQPYNIAMHVASLSVMAIAGVLTVRIWTLFALCLPALLVGTYVGLKLYARVDDRQFRLIVLWLVLASGVVLTV